MKNEPIIGILINRVLDKILPLITSFSYQEEYLEVYCRLTSISLNILTISGKYLGTSYKQAYDNLSGAQQDLTRLQTLSALSRSEQKDPPEPLSLLMGEVSRDLANLARTARLLDEEYATELKPIFVELARFLCDYWPETARQTQLHKIAYPNGNEEREG